MFYPTAGRASVGSTDKNGYYTLGYTRTVKSAEIGEHKVTIVPELTSNSLGEDGQRISSVAGVLRKEMLPPRYGDRKKTELNATVVAGSNVCDCKLESE